MPAGVWAAVQLRQTQEGSVPFQGVAVIENGLPEVVESDASAQAASKHRRVPAEALWYEHSMSKS